MLDPLAQKLQLPRRQMVELEGKDDDGAAGDPAQLGQPGLGRLPVVDRDAGHRRVDGVVVERQGLGSGVDRRRRI